MLKVLVVVAVVVVSVAAVVVVDNTKREGVALANQMTKRRDAVSLSLGKWHYPRVWRLTEMK
jgi:hypothetical protein